MGGDVAGGKEMGATYSSLLNEFTTCFTIDCILHVHHLKALWSLSFGPFHDDVASLSLSSLWGAKAKGWVLGDVMASLQWLPHPSTMGQEE
jgi:hypothetical protein